MQYREILDRYPAAVLSVTLVVFAAAFSFLVYNVWTLISPPAPKERQVLSYFYDLNTGQLFSAPADPGPIETPSGPHQGMPAGVRAHVFACGPCNDESKRYIGWLEVPTAALPGIDEASGEVVAEEDTYRIRRPGDDQWVRVDSREGIQIMQEANTHCGAQRHNYCHPRE